MTAHVPHVLVTDASRGSAVAFIRSLGRRGWRVTAADSDRHSPGFRSRYVSGRLVYPAPTRQADAAVEAIEATVRRTGVDLVIPIADDIGLPLADARDRFEGLTRLALPDPTAMDITHDKAATLSLAQRCGVPIPPTRTVATADEAVREAESLGWPVVIKPRVSRVVTAHGTVEGFTVAYAGDGTTLRTRMRRLEGRTGALLQRWQPGEGIGVELLAHEGRPLAAFQHRRLREVPVTGGASALRESMPLDPILYAHAVSLLARIAWTGLAMVEFRQTPAGPELMEINGRVWGSLPLAVRSGMDFPGRWADLLFDGPPGRDLPVATDYRVGVRARDLRLEATWIANVSLGRRRYPELPFPPRRAAVGALASLLDPRIGDDLLSRDDPKPGLAQVAVVVRDAIALARRRGR
jgi:predicted ATP-grasp superfamily ATP-dependent carboligase